MPEFDGSKVVVLFVLGGPGAGKGTQCQKLVEGFGFAHLSAGDLLREEKDRPGSEFGEEINYCLKEGKIVRMEVTIALLRNRMLAEIKDRQGSDNWRDGAGRFLIDGFPRKMDQALKFEEDVCIATSVLFFDVTENILEERLIERGKTSGRSDDNAESIKKRFRTYIMDTMPVIKYFTEAGKVEKIDSSPSVDEVYAETSKRVSLLLNSRSDLSQHAASVSK